MIEILTRGDTIYYHPFRVVRNPHKWGYKPTDKVGNEEVYAETRDGRWVYPSTLSQEDKEIISRTFAAIDAGRVKERGNSGLFEILFKGGN